MRTPGELDKLTSSTLSNLIITLPPVLSRGALYVSALHEHPLLRRRRPDKHKEQVIGIAHDADLSCRTPRGKIERPSARRN
jgi:hypothetical protein